MTNSCSMPGASILTARGDQLRNGSPVSLGGFARLAGLSGFPWFPRFSRLPLPTASATSSTAPLSTTTPTLASLRLAVFVAVLAIGLGAVVGSQCSRGEALAEVDLGADAVGQVADHEHVLDVVVEVGLNGRGVDLGGEGQSAHEELAQRVVRLLLLVHHGGHVLGCAVD